MSEAFYLKINDLASLCERVVNISEQSDGEHCEIKNKVNGGLSKCFFI